VILLILAQSHPVLYLTTELKQGVCMSFRPLHDRIIVERLDQETKTASGILIPDAAAEKPDQGKVLAVGNGKILEDGKVRPLAVKVGDRVLFGKYSGQAVKLDGKELLIMREDDVMAIVEK
jgi:chaperonin GroES